MSSLPASEYGKARAEYDARNAKKARAAGKKHFCGAQGYGTYGRWDMGPNGFQEPNLAHRPVVRRDGKRDLAADDCANPGVDLAYAMNGLSVHAPMRPGRDDLRRSPPAPLAQRSPHAGNRHRAKEFLSRPEPVYDSQYRQKWKATPYGQMNARPQNLAGDGDFHAYWNHYQNARGIIPVQRDCSPASRRSGHRPMAKPAKPTKKKRGCLRSLFSF